MLRTFTLAFSEAEKLLLSDQRKLTKLKFRLTKDKRLRPNFSDFIGALSKQKRKLFIWALIYIFIMAKKKIQPSTIFFWIAGIFLFVLVAKIFGILPMSVVGVELGQEGIKATISDISETTAVLLFIPIVSALIGAYLKSKGK